jgi:hypothetical protein
MMNTTSSATGSAKIANTSHFATFIGVSLRSRLALPP